MLVLLRHAETSIDPQLRGEFWRLSAVGHAQADSLVNTLAPYLENFTALYASSQRKTRDTLLPISKAMNLPINQTANFDELMPPKFLTPNEFQQMRMKQFADWDYREPGCETANEVIGRFRTALDLLPKDRNIIICSHGTVLTLYFSQLLEISSADNIFEYWKSLDFCAFGIVDADRVIKSIFT